MPAKYAVGFDFDHTLGLDNKLERTVALDMLARCASENGAPPYDDGDARAAADAALEAFRSGALTVELAIAAFLERFVPAEGRVCADTAAGFREAVLARVTEFVKPVDGAPELLASLIAAGVPIALLTNGWSPLQEEKARAIAFEGPVYVSERIGSRKPDPQAFATLRAGFDREPVDILYVGDDPVADIAGAHAVGMRTVWFDWENKTYPADVAAPDFTIHNLSELSAIVQGRH